MKKETVIKRLNTYGNDLIKGRAGWDKRAIEAQVTTCLRLLQEETWVSLGEKVPATMQAIVQESIPLNQQDKEGTLSTEQERHYQGLILRYCVYQKFRELINTSVRSACSAKRSREQSYA